MRFYEDNRTDRPYEVPVRQLADEFVASHWSAVHAWPIERRVNAFLTDRKPCGAWDVNDTETRAEYDELITEIVSAWQAEEAAQREAGEW